MQIICDKFGREYQQITCNSDKLLLVRLLSQDDEVGKIQCVYHLPEMLLGDLIVDDAVVHLSDKGYLKLWQTAFKPKPVNYRQRGLGTHLLKFAIERAREKGVKLIYGSLTEEDVAATLNLANWYRLQGFELSAPTAEDVSSAVARISMKLD